MNLKTLLLILFILLVVAKGSSKKQKEAARRAKEKNSFEEANQFVSRNMTVPGQESFAAESSGYGGYAGFEPESSMEGTEPQAPAPSEKRRPAAAVRPAAAPAETPKEEDLGWGSLQGFASDEGKCTPGHLHGGTAARPAAEPAETPKEEDLGWGSLQGFVSDEGKCTPGHLHGGTAGSMLDLAGRYDSASEPAFDQGPNDFYNGGKPPRAGKRPSLVFAQNPAVNGIIWSEILKRPCERRR